MNENVFHIVDYHPVNRNGVRNPEFSNSQDSKKLLNFKDETNSSHKAAVNYFTGKFVAFCQKNEIVLSDFDLVAIAPSSQAGRYSSGLRTLLSAVCNGKVRFEHTLLLRHTTIQSMHNGGSRSPLIHYQSISVNTSLLLGASKILLVDDVITTGSTHTGCVSKLNEAGIHDVSFIALARTV